MTATVDVPILPSPRPPAYPPVVVRRLPPLDPEPAAESTAGPATGSTAEPIADSTAAPTAAPTVGSTADWTTGATAESTAVPVAGTRPAPAPARPSVPGNPRVEIERVLRLLMEMLDGRRPATQAGGRIGPMALRYLVAARSRLNPAGRGVGTARHGPPGLRSFRMSHPAENATEVSAHWAYRGRSRALAARFEWRAERWRCTVLRLG